MEARKTTFDIDYKNGSKLPGLLILIVVNTVSWAILLAGLSFGITIAFKKPADPVTNQAFINGFWGGLAGGLFGLLGSIIGAIMYILHARRKCAEINLLAREV